MTEKKPRGRPRKNPIPVIETVTNVLGTYDTEIQVIPEEVTIETCRVIVMHKTNIVLSTGKEPHAAQVEIPVSEFEGISAGDKAAGRPQRLVKMG